jgi:hypothetical protein
MRIDLYTKAILTTVCLALVEGISSLFSINPWLRQGAGIQIDQ